MARHAALLRGINLGARNRVSMPVLREALEAAGFADVATYLQSGNVAVTTSGKAEDTARAVERVVADAFGLEIVVVARTRAELAKVVERDPFGAVATDPKRYQVTFLRERPPKGLAARLEEARVPSEAVEVHGREVYAWQPEGVARSKLWNLLGGKGLGVAATTRNWTTVTALLALADATP